MIESADDRAAFFADDGVIASYTPAGGAPSLLLGLFDRPPVDVAVGGIVATLDARPSFLVRTADLPASAAVDVGDKLAIPAMPELGISAVVYDVVKIEPDGTGMSLLILGR